MSEIKYIFELYNEGYDKKFINYCKTDDKIYILNRYRTFYNTDKIKDQDLYNLIDFNYDGLKVNIICKIEDADAKYMYHYIQSLVDDPDENYIYKYVKRYEEGYYIKKKYDSGYSKKYQKQYREKNKEKMKKYNRDYKKKYVLNDHQKEQNKIRCKKYYREHKERIKEQMRQHYKNKKFEIREKMRRKIKCPHCEKEMRRDSLNYHIKNSCIKINCEN